MSVQSVQDLRFSMKMVSAPGIVPRQPVGVITLSGRLLLQFAAGCEAACRSYYIVRQAAPAVRCRLRGIHLREKSIAYPTEKSENALAFS